jgi:hypothetical protein
MIAIKEQAIRLIKTLPVDATLEDIQYHLYVREKVERGIQAADNGCIVSQQTAEKKVKQWLKSSGRSRR